MSVEFKTIQELANKKFQKRASPIFDGCWLHYNGPGSSGYGVKRTAMLTPETAMLMVGPMGCGRSGTVVAEKFKFSHRMFYLNLDDKSISLGTYIKRVFEAAKYINSLNEFKAILICMTCIDALLGTDLEGLGKKISKELGICITTTFMDPIVRDGNYGPMVQIRQAITDCFENNGEKNNSINVLGTFAAVDENSELCEILRYAGINKIKTAAGCSKFEDLKNMGNSAANIVIHSQSIACGKDLKARLGIPYIYLPTSYNKETVADNYKKLGELLGFNPDYSKYSEACEKECQIFFDNYKNSKIGIGEAVIGNPFDIAYFLLLNGIRVPFIFRDMIKPEDWEIISRINEIEPDIPVYSGVHPSTFCNSIELPEADLILGLDAGYFNQSVGSVTFSFDEFNYGYSGIINLVRLLKNGFEAPIAHKKQINGTYLTV